MNRDTCPPDRVPTNILIIRPGAIGDCLLTFPVIRAIREKYSNPHLTFVSNARVLPLALAFGLAETASDYQQLQWAELFSTTGIHTSTILEQLQHIHLAICWLRDPDGLLERNLRTAGVKQQIIAPGRPPEGMHIHIVEYLAQTVGVMASGFRHEDVASFQLKNAIHRVSTDSPIAIHPGSGADQKCWPAHRFADVIKQLWNPNGLDGYSHSVLLLTGPADQKRIHDILNSIGNPPQTDMLKVMFDAPLLEVAHQLQHCSCYLGNDSGITHLASMLGVPTIALFGPSDPAIWRPIGPAVRVIRAQMLEDLDTDVVIDALASCLSIG